MGGSESKGSLYILQRAVPLEATGLVGFKFAKLIRGFPKIVDPNIVT